MNDPSLPEELLNRPSLVSDSYSLSAIGQRINDGFEGERPLKAYLQVLVRYRVTISLIALIIIVSAALVTFMLPRQYTATAMVNIGTYVPPLEGPIAEMLRSETTKGHYVKNQVPLLETHVLAKRVLEENPEILAFFSKKKKGNGPNNQKSEAATGKEPSLPLLAKYMRAVRFLRIKETDIVKISATTTSADISAKIANAHASAFTSLVKEQRLNAANINLKFLRTRVEETARKAARADEAVLKYAKENALFLADEHVRTSALSEKLRFVFENLQRVISQRMTSEAEYRDMRISPSNDSDAYDNELRSEYIKLNKTKAEYEEAKKYIRNKEHPYLTELSREAGSIEDVLKANYKQRVKDTELRYRASVDQERMLKDELSRLQKDELDVSQKLIQYKLLQQEKESAQEIHEQVARRLEDALVNAENDQSNVVLLDPAVPPATFSSPKIHFNILMGCFFGPLFGIAIAFLLDFLDDTVQTVADSRRMLNVPIMGIVPSFGNTHLGVGHKHIARGVGRWDRRFLDAGGVYVEQTKALDLIDEDSPVLSLPKDKTIHGASLDQTNTPIGNDRGEDRLDRTMSLSRAYEADDDQPTVIIDNKSLVVYSSPSSDESEAFRHIRTCLAFGSSTEAPKILLVTSGQKDDGKSTVASNLAAAMARASVRTLLIDADLRLPTIQNHFGISLEAAGLSEVLRGEARYEDVLIRTPIENLVVVVAGGPVENPGELTGSSKMKEFLDLASDEFDQIILDSPPVGRVSDGLILSRFVEGVLLVIRSGRTPVPIAKSALNKLRQVDARILGAVLNDVKRSNSYREEEYYSTGGDYY